MPVNKTDFIKRLAENRKCTKAEAERELEGFFDTFLECLREDGTVKLYGVGRFELKTVKEGLGRNPRNGKEYVVPEHKKLKFYASKTLSNRIEEGQ